MARPLSITIGVLFALWLISLTIMLCFLADLVGIPALVGALVVQVGVAAVGSALLLVTNTRPSPPPPPAAPVEAITLPDGRSFGRRREDKSIVDKISDLMEEEAAKRPGPARTPDWAINVVSEE